MALVDWLDGDGCSVSPVGLIVFHMLVRLKARMLCTVICGCMTAPCSIALFFAIPDYPQNTTAFYLTERDIAIANARCARNKKKAIRGNFTLGVVKRTLFRWEYTAFVLLYVLYGQSVQPASYYGIWLKDKKQSTVVANIYPTFTSYIEMGKC